MHSVGTVPVVKMHPVGTIPKGKVHHVDPVPRFQMYPEGTVIKFIVKTQRNSTQLNSKATSVGVRHSTHVFHPPPHHPTTANFSATSRPARELKFGRDTH